MDITTAVTFMSALAQSTRMEAFRLLVNQGADGLPAGEIAAKLQVPHNTLSTHLTILGRWMRMLTIPDLSRSSEFEAGW